MIPTVAPNRPASTFDRYSELASNVEGWFNALSIALWDVLLTHQNTQKITGDLLEIGVWQGKSAGMLAAHTRPTETLRLVDIYVHENLKANLEAFGTAFRCDIEFNRSDSFAFFTSDFLTRHRRSFRLIHVDGHHVAHAIWDDLSHAAHLLSADGLLIVDDFCNTRFPQVTECLYRFLDRNADEFAMFLCGGNKAYVSRVRAHENYLSLVSSTAFPTALALRNVVAEQHPATACHRPMRSINLASKA